MAVALRLPIVVHDTPGVLNPSVETWVLYTEFESEVSEWEVKKSDGPPHKPSLFAFVMEIK